MKREVAVLPFACSKPLSYGLNMGISCHTGGNFGRENWDGQMSRWEQVLSMYTENEGGRANLYFFRP